jgi:predicted nucleotidyltransferase component of viral defense system
MNISIRPLSTEVIELIESKFKINPIFTEKDWYTQHILGVISRFESDEFQPVFSGGTSLSKGYRLIERFSEDIDFRVKPLKQGLTRAFRSRYQDRLVAAILDSSPDLSLYREVYKRDRSNFLKIQIAYESQFSGADALRPFIQVELSFDEPPLLEPVIRPLSSIVNQFTQQEPEIAGMPCLSLVETASDKIAALSWRVVSKEPDAERYDPRIIRHLHDLSYLAPLVQNDPQFTNLARKTIQKDINGRGRDLDENLKTVPKLLTALTKKLESNPLYKEHYRDFVETVSYGESPSFEIAIGNLGKLTEHLVLEELLNGDAVVVQQVSSQEEDLSIDQ